MSSFISKPTFPNSFSNRFPNKKRSFNLYAKDLLLNGMGAEFQSNVPQNLKGQYVGLNSKGEFWLNKARSRKDNAIEFQKYCFGKAIEFKQNQHVNIDYNDICVVGLCLNESAEIINSCVTSPIVFYGSDFVLTHTGSIYKLGDVCPVDYIYPKVINMRLNIKDEYKCKYKFLK